jgi:hypothetical protein
MTLTMRNRLFTVQRLDMLYSTHYDPFYPELHIYDTSPLFSQSSPTVSVSVAFQEGGITGVAMKLFDDLCAFLAHLPVKWNPTSAPETGMWPPT